MPQTILANKTDVTKTVTHMRSQIEKAAANPKIQSLAQTFLIYPIPEKAIFNYVYEQVAYVPDEGDYQDIRTPQRSLKDHVGNCVDYTVLMGSLLMALRIPFQIKVVEVEPDYGFEHVYIITDKYVLDPCLGQPQDGTAPQTRPATGKFNKETIFYNYKLYNMTKLRLLQGAGRISRAVKVAKLSGNNMQMDKYMDYSGNKLGILCLKNCACKNDCSGMFAALDTSTEKLCRQWCDDVKAKRNSLTASKDPYWQQKYNALIATDVAGTADEPAPEVTTTESSGIEDIIKDLIGSIFGPSEPTTPTYTGPPPTPTIMGIPQNTALIIGAVVVGGIAYFATRPKRKGRRR